MTRIDFYVIDGGAGAHDQTICRVIEKAWQQGNALYVCCDDDAQAQAFDALLWRFRDTSFVPHGLEVEGDADTPVVIGTAAGGTSAEVLVNLSVAVPDSVSRFSRVVESAGHDDTTREAARARYRYYQDRGFPLHTHKLAR